MMRCPKCDADVSDSYAPDDWSVGFVGGWYCEACDYAIGLDEAADDGDFADAVIVSAPPRSPDQPIGTPISQLSGRPGELGFAEFCHIAKSWGYD